MKKLLFVLLILAFKSYSQAKIKWPENKEAAIILTYDDALVSQLNIAVPHLDKYNLKATFFLDGRMTEEDMTRWKEVASKGHELANHTLYHPCIQRSKKSHPRLYSDSYDPEWMIKEIDMMNKFLFLLDGKKSRTLAYPCSETTVGGKDYKDTLENSHLVKYARAGGGSNSFISDFKQLDPFKVISYPVQPETTIQELINFIKKVQIENGMAVFTFHGIGGDYITTSEEVHLKVVNYLAENENVWVVPFKEVMDYVMKYKKDL